MNIEESEKEIEKIKEMFMHLKNYGWINDIKKEIDIDKVIEAIETLLTAYEKEKGKNVKLRLQDIPLIQGELKAYKDRVNELKQELEKEKEKNKKAIKYCKEKSTFQTFGDFELQNVLETYINRLKHRILDILEE